MSAKRLDLNPEPADWVVLHGLDEFRETGNASHLEELPAAGHLGVQEVQCGSDDMQGLSFGRGEFVGYHDLNPQRDGLPCSDCGAVV